MPLPSFTNLGPENQLAILKQISLRDKPTLYSLASTNRVMKVLATPVLVQAYVEHVESKIETMTTSAEKVSAILLIHKKLVDNADSLSVPTCVDLWKRLTALAVKEANCMGSVDKLYKGIEGNIFVEGRIRFNPLAEISVESLIATQQSVALLDAIGKVLARQYEKFGAALDRAVTNL